MAGRRSNFNLWRTRKDHKLAFEREQHIVMPDNQQNKTRWTIITRTLPATWVSFVHVL